MDKKDYKKAMRDKSSALTVVSMTLAFALVIALSFGARFYFRPGVDDSFWGDLAIQFALCVYCLYFGVPEAKNLYMKKPEGRYQLALTDFKSKRGEVGKRDFEFNQWLEKYYDRNKADYFKAILSLHGNINEKVLDLDLSEIDKLSKPYKKCWDGTEFEGREDTYFRSLTDSQIDIIKEIMKGKIKVERIPDDFFKTIDGRIVLSEYVEKSREKRKKSGFYALLIVSRIIMVFIFAFVFSAFGIKIASAQSAEEVLQQIVTTISRIWTMVSSFAYGFSLGKTMVTDSASMLEYKARVNGEFLSDKTFVAKNEEEIAKEEWENGRNDNPDAVDGDGREEE